LVAVKCGAAARLAVEFWTVRAKHKKMAAPTLQRRGQLIREETPRKGRYVSDAS
jgi:hypothetical protein